MISSSSSHRISVTHEDWFPQYAHTHTHMKKKQLAHTHMHACKHAHTHTHMHIYTIVEVWLAGIPITTL